LVEADRSEADTPYIGESSENIGSVGRFFEGIVTVVILLVIVQTFLDDFAVVMSWAEEHRRMLLFTGFAFDFFFTVEFLVRFYNAILRRRAAFYIVHEKGWIDFLASIPLLMFSSGPPVLSYLLQEAALLQFGGILNMLKLVKAIRIARILRLLRIVKIFKNIKYADSPMAQRHISKIITISITIIVLSMFAYSVLDERIDAIGADAAIIERQTQLVHSLSEDDPLKVIERADPQREGLLLIKKSGSVLYSRFDDNYLKSQFEPGDFRLYEEKDVEVFFDSRATNLVLERDQSWRSLFFFAIVLLLVFTYLLVYSPHFAITVTDPIHVMRRGFQENDYNLEVRVPEIYRGDDIFKMAELYNNEYLPLKDRNRESVEAAGPELKLDDIREILE
jgi:hypothetical protein